MDKIKLELKDKNDAELLQFVEEHIAAMTGNANFATPNPPADEFAAAKAAFAAALTESNTAQEIAKQKTLLKDQARAALEASLRIRGGYVESTAKGNAAIIITAKLPVRSARAPIGELPAPLDFLATMGDQPGEIDVIWSGVRGAGSYILEMSPYAGERTWKQVDVVLKSKATVAGLTSGQKYVFRVRAVGTKGPGPWSDESVQMSP